ncbi:efflux RND transporter permease subunit [Coprothermobacter platensis]|uniref:efflux RND transporter permease subunit n=1 Tax=Coprothermobacter platensis TaxID=108819 RepID=UPI0003717517|nr:MMPL family transporter [Coprothermobacter platensis]
MQGFAHFVVKYRKFIIALYLILAVLSFFAMQSKTMNYDITSALPKNVPSIEAMRILNDEMQVGESITIYWKNGSLSEVSAAVDRIKQIPKVINVSWLGTTIDPATPRELYPEDASTWVKGNDYNVVVQTTATTGEIGNITSQLKSFLPANAKIISTDTQMEEVKNYFAGKPMLYFGLGLLLVFLFLLFYFDKPLTPILIVVSMAAGVLINLGISGILKQSTFYLVDVIVEVLQLAVSYDYALFLYHRYEEERKTRNDDEAMESALITTIKAISLSALTTIAGFFALTFATLTISQDIGWLLLRGVALSFLSSITLLPALLLSFEGKFVWKTLNLENIFGNIAATVEKVLVPLFIVLLVFVTVAFWGGTRTKITYSNDVFIPSQLSSMKLQQEYQKEFQNYDTWMVLLDKNSNYTAALKSIKNLPLVQSVLNPATMLDQAIPQEMLPSSVLNSFSSDQYVYAIVNTKVKPDTPQAEELRAQIENIINGLPGKNYVTGMSIAIDDIKQISMQDNTKTGWITLLLIFLILLAGFRNVWLSLLLMGVIEAAVQFNLWSAGWFQAVTFMVPITLSTVQLGSTIDYAVLSATRFEEAVEQGEENPLDVAIRGAAPSIFVSASTFFLMSLPSAVLTDISGLSQIMGGLARGAIISGLVVIFLLPTAFKIFQKFLFGRSVKA